MKKLEITSKIEIHRKNIIKCGKLHKTRDHLNGVQQIFNLRSARQLFVRYLMVKSVNLRKFIISSACNSGQCLAMIFIDASVKFLHIEKYKPIV